MPLFIELETDNKDLICDVVRRYMDSSRKVEIGKKGDHYFLLVNNEVEPPYYSPVAT